MSLDSPLLQCKRANPRRRVFRRRSHRLSTTSGCPTGVGGGGELRIRRPVYSFLLPRSRLGLGSGGIVSSPSSVPDGAFCLLGVGSGDGSGGFGFNGCAARCSAGGRSRSLFDRAGDVGVSSFPLFSAKGWEPGTSLWVRGLSGPLSHSATTDSSSGRRSSDRR